MSIVEKAAILGSLAFVGGFSVYTILKPSTGNLSKENV